MELKEYLELQKKTRRKPRHEEANEQMAFVRYVRAKHPKLPIFMSPIFKFGGTRIQQLIQGKRMKDMGYTPGTPDITIPVKGKCYCGLCLEFKTEIGKVSTEQEDVLKHCRDNGYFTAVVRSCDEAIKVFDWYMFKI